MTSQLSPSTVGSESPSASIPTHSVAGATRSDDVVATDVVKHLTAQLILVVRVQHTAGQAVGAVAQTVVSRDAVRGARRPVDRAAQAPTHRVVHVREG